MVQRTSYAPGTPSWIDLGSPDPQGSAAFYGGLFGWDVEFDPRPESGGYAMCMLRGLPVAGLGPQMSPGPPYWSVYVTVADADETLERAVANGGTVVMAGMDVLDVGRMGIFQDPGGSYISVWEPRAHIGANLVNEHGTFVWNELATTDLATARTFYAVVFGWGEETTEHPDTGAIFTVDGAVVCGAHAAGEGEFPAWSVWFAVDDCDAAAAKAQELGASVIVAPNDMGFGRGAVLADPQGAVFGIGTMNAAG